MIATTQSLDCPEGVQPKSANLQVYVPNAPGTLQVEDCSDQGVWP